MRVRDDSPLRALGWDAAWQAAADATRLDATPGRVARVDFSRVTVLTEAGSAFATPGEEPIATGDWVLLENDRVIAILPRRTAFVRGDPMEGKALDAQVLAANVDIVFIVQSLTNGPKIGRAHV